MMIPREHVVISRCLEGELEQVMGFIDVHWSKRHVLARDRALMCWQHGDPDGNGCMNWLVARNNSELLGIIGYVPSRIYSGLSSVGNRVVWVALWKVRPEAGAGLGLRLLKSIEHFEPHDCLGILGLNSQHLPMYRALGFRTGELRQSFAVNSCVDAFKILQLPSSWRPPGLKPGATKLVPWLGEHEFLANSSRKGWMNARIKNERYFERRYLKHPTYSYEVYKLILSGEEGGLLALRRATARDRSVLRIIDFMGDPNAFAQMGTALGKLLTELDVEYVDIWDDGLPVEFLRRLGMETARGVEGLVVPNYFEPFLPENGRIEFAMKGFEGLDYLVMRGDGDQDRPND